MQHETSPSRLGQDGSPLSFDCLETMSKVGRETPFRVDGAA
jgi:hypothetical protein